MLTDGTKSIDCEFEENGALPACGYETAPNSKLNWTLRSHGKTRMMCRRTHMVLNQGRSQGFTLGAQEGTRIEAPRGGGWGRAPSANAFLAYLRPTELVVERTVPTKPGFFRKKIHSIDDWGRGIPGMAVSFPLWIRPCAELFEIPLFIHLS